jgi:hypothetical protein
LAGRTRSFFSVESWGLWQSRQAPLLNGECWDFPLTRPPWQLRHRSLGVARRRPFPSAAWGMWQAKHFPSFTGWCCMPVRGMGPWQPSQSPGIGFARRAVWPAPGRWHAEQLPGRKGTCCRSRNIPTCFDPWGLWQVGQLSAFRDISSWDLDRAGS